MEKKLWEKDEEILFLNALLEMKFMRNYTTTTKIHSVEAEIERSCEANMDFGK